MERDPVLGSGWAYFVEDKPYLDYVLSHADEEDVSPFALNLRQRLINLCD